MKTEQRTQSTVKKKQKFRKPLIPLKIKDSCRFLFLINHQQINLYIANIIRTAGTNYASQYF